MKIIKSQMENESFSFCKRKINVNKDWSVKRLSDHILSIKNGIYGDPIEKNSTSDIVNVFTLNCFSNNKKEAIVQRVIKSSSLNGRILESGDIVIERSGGGKNFEVGRSFVFKKENDLIHTAVDFTRIIKLKEGVSPEYIQLLLSYFNKNGTMTKFAQKTTKISNLSKEFFDLKFPMPNDILMQYKIAKVLSQQEEQVNKIKTLIEKLEKRNQYYTERLLSGELRVREGDDGKVDFYENTEWKEIFINGRKKKIPNDAHITTLRKEYKDSFKKGSEGLSNYIEIGDVDIETKEYNLDGKEKLSVSSCKIVPCSTLLISTVRPTRRCFTITKKELPVSSAFVRFNIEKDSYPLHIINTIDFSSFCKRNAEGGTYPVIKSYNIEGYQYCILPEKNKISEILDLLILEKNNLISLLEKEQKRFDWMSDALLSGEYQIVD